VGEGKKSTVTLGEVNDMRPAKIKKSRVLSGPWRWQLKKKKGGGGNKGWDSFPDSEKEREKPGKKSILPGLR